MKDGSGSHYSIDSYDFAKSDFVFYFKNLLKDRGTKAFYQFMNRPIRRSHSRSLIKRFSPNGYGLELGCGERTISPANRTVMSDFYSIHGTGLSIAKVFFDCNDIPYSEGTFDFVLSEHMLEHLTDPIKALKEQIRVLKEGGCLFCFLPHKDRTNDCHRETTTLDHLISDYENQVAPDDDFHLDEWLKNVVDRNLMPEHYKHLSREELLTTASIHHHAWTEKEIAELFEYLGLEVVHKETKVHDRRDTFVVIGKKVKKD